MNKLPFVYNDGGRAEAGFKGRARDCAARAISIATSMPYFQVYSMIAQFAASERIGKRKRGKSNARTGVYRTTMEKLMKFVGWKWHPTMQIGQGCRVHLRQGELPNGNLIVSVSKHYVAVKNGVIYDTHDPSRDGMRCVYGYYSKD